MVSALRRGDHLLAAGQIVKQVAGEPRGVISELLGEDESGEFVAEIVAEIVAAAVGASEESASIDETHWAVRRLLEALARERPLVVVLEDLQWAEPTFLDLLEYIASFGVNPILLLASARPELLETRPAWAKVRPTSQLLLLEPLAEPEVDALIDGRLEGGALSERSRARVLEVAEGNPLFVEQLLAMQAGGGDAEGELGVPPTLRALLAGRIDRLEAGERAVLERATVEGRSFHRGAVAELLPPPKRAAVGALLLALVRRELIRPDRSEFADDDGYRFAHVLIRDAAYESTAKELRAELHERYANWLERKVGDHVREHEEILGYHLEQACRYRRELVPVDEQTLALARRAATRLASAGRRARPRGDMLAAAALLSRAVSLLPEADPDRVRLLPDLGLALDSCGDYREASTVLEEAIERAAAAGDERTRNYALLFHLGLRTSVEPGFTGEEALGQAQQALQAFEELGDEGGQGHALWSSAYYHSMRGHHAEAREELERALAHATTAAVDEDVQDRMRSHMAFNLFWGPASLDESVSYAERLLDQQSTAKGRRDLPLRRWLGIARALQGRFETARALLAGEVAELEKFGNTFGAAVAAAHGFGTLDMLAGDPAAAERHLSEGCRVLKEVGEIAHLSTLAAQLAHALYAQGRYEEAARQTRISEETAAHDDYASQILWRTARAKAFARQGRIAEAERLAREAVTLAEDTDDINGHGDALMALAEVVRVAERPSEAIRVIQEALKLYERKGNVVSAGKARALLGELEAVPSPDLASPGL
jgi:predicted ATPase